MLLYHWVDEVWNLFLSSFVQIRSVHKPFSGLIVFVGQSDGWAVMFVAFYIIGPQKYKIQEALFFVEYI